MDGQKYLVKYLLNSIARLRVSSYSLRDRRRRVYSSNYTIVTNLFDVNASPSRITFRSLDKKKKEKTSASLTICNERENLSKFPPVSKRFRIQILNFPLAVEESQRGVWESSGNVLSTKENDRDTARRRLEVGDSRRNRRLGTAMNHFRPTKEQHSTTAQTK